MKKIILSLISVLFIMSYVRAEGVDDFFQKYHSKEKVEASKIPFLFIRGLINNKDIPIGQAFGGIDLDKNQEKELLRILAEIDEINTLRSTNKDINIKKKFYSEFIAKSKEYKLFTEISNQDLNASWSVYTKKSNDKIIRNIIFVMESATDKSLESLLIYVKGKLTSEDLVNVIKIFNKK